MWICPRCRRRQAAHFRACPDDGGPLLEMDADDPFAGTVLANRFLVLSRLGKGGMGDVYRGVQLSVERPVALKLLPPSEEGDRGDLERRFAREARLTAALRSPHTVTVHDFGIRDDGGMFIAMELVDGEPLNRLLSREAPLAPARVCRLLAQVCRSLEEAHASGLVHRDLKPGNVVVERDAAGEEVLKVLDFGLVKAVGDVSQLTQAGAVFGTPAYMAPEQCLGREVGPATDLYAVGAMAFEMLTARPPYRSDNPLSLMMMHVHEPVPKLAGAPPDLAALVDELLAKVPEERPPSAGALRGRLEALAEALVGHEPLWPVDTPTSDPPDPDDPALGALATLAPDSKPDEMAELSTLGGGAAAPVGGDAMLSAETLDPSSDELAAAPVPEAAAPVRVAEPEAPEPVAAVEVAAERAAEARGSAAASEQAAGAEAAEPSARPAPAMGEPPSAEQEAPAPNSAVAVPATPRGSGRAMAFGAAFVVVAGVVAWQVWPRPTASTPAPRADNAPSFARRAAGREEARRPEVGLELAFAAPPARQGPSEVRRQARRGPDDGATRSVVKKGAVRAPRTPGPGPSNKLKVSLRRAGGGMDKGLARKTIGGLAGKLRRCYRRAGASGSVTLRLTVRPTGHVMGVGVGGSGTRTAEVLACAKPLLKGATYPPFDGARFAVLEIGIGP